MMGGSAHFGRRMVLAGLAAALPVAMSAQPRTTPGAPLRKIAAEEAFMIPEFVEPIRRVRARGGASLELPLMRLLFGVRPAEMVGPAPGSRDAIAVTLPPRLLDLGAGRLAQMDVNGVDAQLLSIGIPGVQMFSTSEAPALARAANDRLRAAIEAHPTRFAGLACFAPQDPLAAAREMERAATSLNLNGFIVNSHTDNLYLDDQRFSPILEAAEALGRPLYIHPRAPSDGMAGPFRDYRLEGATWGYGIEVATHVLRLMLGGALDRFPKLKLVIGHIGEALPFRLWRLDIMAQPGSHAGRRNALTPSEYMKRNVRITTSGVEDPAALRFAIDKLDADKVMWAIDHPFQPTAPAVRFLETAPPSPEERALVAHRNAERLFGMPSAGRPTHDAHLKARRYASTRQKRSWGRQKRRPWVAVDFRQPIIRGKVSRPFRGGTTRLLNRQFTWASRRSYSSQPLRARFDPFLRKSVLRRADR